MLVKVFQRNRATGCVDVCIYVSIYLSPIIYPYHLSIICISSMYVCMYLSICHLCIYHLSSICLSLFFLNNGLMQLWGFLSSNLQASQQARDPGQSGHPQFQSPFSGEISFCSTQAFSQLDEAHLHYQLFSKSTNLNVNSHLKKKHFHRNT